jgi:hypothetical protein
VKRAMALLALLAGCSTTAPEPPDYSKFYAHQPTTILVLPVINQTTAADAPIAFSSTILHPLVERGYYIFPLPATLEILQANGIYEGGQLENVDPTKFAEILGVDALLYVTLHAWDTNYAVIASSVEVAMSFRLDDARTGETIWENSVQRSVSSGSGGSGDLLADLLIAVVDAATTAAATDYVPLARDANAGALASLPPGPLRDDHQAVRTQLLADRAAWEAAQAAPSQP